MELGKMADCKDRHVYKVHSRNLKLGVWIAEYKAFIGIRNKFGESYLSAEYHHDFGGTARQKDEIGKCEVLSIQEGKGLHSLMTPELFKYLETKEKGNL